MRRTVLHRLPCRSAQNPQTHRIGHCLAKQTRQILDVSTPKDETCARPGSISSNLPRISSLKITGGGGGRQSYGFSRLLPDRRRISKERYEKVSRTICTAGKMGLILKTNEAHFLDRKSLAALLPRQVHQLKWSRAGKDQTRLGHSGSSKGSQQVLRSLSTAVTWRKKENDKGCFWGHPSFYGRGGTIYLSSSRSPPIIVDDERDDTDIFFRDLQALQIIPPGRRSRPFSIGQSIDSRARQIA